MISRYSRLDDLAIISGEITQRHEAIADERSPRRRSESIWGGQIAMVCVIGAGIAGLALFASQVSEQDQELASAEEPCTGVIVRSEMISVCLPPALLEMARGSSAGFAPRTHADLRRYLEERGHAGLWYAVTIRAHRADGEFVDMQFIRQPCNQANDSPEFPDVWAIAAADSPAEFDEAFSAVPVHIVPDAFVKLEARDVISLLHNRPDALTP